MAIPSSDDLPSPSETTRVHRAFDVWNQVPLVAQTTGMSCWAAAAAMLVGWRERLVVDPDDVARGAGRWREFRNGLHPVDVAALADRWRLAMEQGDDVWEVARFRDLLEAHGPLWVGEASPGLHAIVVTGLYGDGTPEGTRVRVNDPWPVGVGERYTISFRELRENFDEASRLTGDRAHILHSGGRSRGRSGIWRAEQRTTRRRIHHDGNPVSIERSSEMAHHEEFGSFYGQVAVARALDVRAGDRYVDTTRGGSNPLAGHGGAGENLYLGWTAVPDDVTTIDVVVHLHGYTASDPTRSMLEGKVAASGLDLTGRTRPTLAILPRGRKITADEIRRARQAGKPANPSRYTFPALLAQQGSGLEALLQYALTFFGREVLGGRTITPARLIITAHSGGGAPLNDLLSHRARRAACDPHEVHVFDALYGPVQGIADWVRSRVARDAALASGGAGAEEALAREGGGCRVLYRPDTRSGSVELAGAFPTSSPLRPAYRAEATGVAHGDIPRVFGRALLTSVRADLVLIPSRAHALVSPIEFDGAAALAADDDARSWLAADEAGRAALSSSVHGWMLATDRSAIELLSDSGRRQHFRDRVNWQHQDFPGRGSRTAETEALFNELQRIVPERRVPGALRYHSVDAVVTAVPGNGGARLFPEATDAFVRMREAASADGVTLTILSAWRSAATQDRIRSGNANPAAVARGVSAHTYGLAIDLALTVPGLRLTEISTASMPNMVAMYRSPVYKWMALNGRRFGWFPYRREPWHWEYNPEGFRARYEAAGRTGGALNYGAPTGLFEAYAPSSVSAPLDDTSGRATRSRA